MMVTPSTSYASEAEKEATTPSLEQIARTLRSRGFQADDVIKMVRAWAHVSQTNQDEERPRKSRAVKKLLMKKGKEGSGYVKFRTAAKAAQTVSRLKMACGKGRPSGKNILEDFGFLKDGKLGVGAHAVVYVVRSRESGKQFACKCIKKSLMGPAQRKGLLQEAALMRSIDHDNIVKLWHFYEDTQIYYLVMDLIEGGELFHRIVKRSSYTERKARDATRAVLEAVRYLHDHGIVHRDIKPENLLCVSQESDTDVKLCDFGYATRLDGTNPSKCLTRVCGTTAYLAPEIVSRQPYGPACDLWSVGCVVFILLSGYPPFGPSNDGRNDQRLCAKIAKGSFVFHSPYWDTISDQAKNFVSSLLHVDPNTRLSAAQALDHVWLQEDPASLEEHDLTQTTIPQLIKYNARNKFRSAVGGITAAKRLAAGHTMWE